MTSHCIITHSTLMMVFPRPLDPTIDLVATSVPRSTSMKTFYQWLRLIPLDHLECTRYPTDILFFSDLLTKKIPTTAPLCKYTMHINTSQTHREHYRTTVYYKKGAHCGSPKHHPKSKTYISVASPALYSRIKFSSDIYHDLQYTIGYLASMTLMIRFSTDSECL